MTEWMVTPSIANLQLIPSPPINSSTNYPYIHKPIYLLHMHLPPIHSLSIHSSPPACISSSMGHPPNHSLSAHSFTAHPQMLLKSSLWVEEHANQSRRKIFCKNNLSVGSFISWPQHNWWLELAGKSEILWVSGCWCEIRKKVLMKRDIEIAIPVKDLWILSLW